MNSERFFIYLKKHGTALFFIFFLLSLGLLGLTSLWEEGTLAREIHRDVAMGFLVAAIVGGIYEVHARSQFNRHTMADVLSIIMDEVVEKEIWAEVKKQVIEKNWIRDRMHVKLELRSAPEHQLAAGEMLLWVQIRYDAANLRATRRTETIYHNLDEHRRRGSLPRYTRVLIDDEPVPLNDDTVKDGEFAWNIDLEPRDGKPRRILVEREEIVYIPGTYVLTMGNLAKRISVELDEIPADLQSYVLIRPHRDHPVPLRLHNALEYEFEDILLLPGQVLEFRFHPTLRAEQIPAQKVVGSGEVVVAGAKA